MMTSNSDTASSQCCLLHNFDFKAIEFSCDDFPIVFSPIFRRMGGFRFAASETPNKYQLDFSCLIDWLSSTLISCLIKPPATAKKKKRTELLAWLHSRIEMACAKAFDRKIYLFCALILHHIRYNLPFSSFIGTIV